MAVQTLAIIVLLVSFFVMIFLRFPIAYAVGLSSVLCMMVQGQALTDVCRLMVKGISSFSLMAVPFFITMGVLMGSGGISEKLIALADANGQHRCFLLLRRYFRFCICRYCFHRLHHDPHDGRSGLRCRLLHCCYHHLLLRGSAGSSEPQHGHLCHHCRRHLGRQPVPGRLSARCSAGHRPDDRFLHHLGQGELPQGLSVQHQGLR